MMQELINFFTNNKLLAISTPFYIVLITLEVVLSNYQKKKYYNLKDTLINLWLNLANTLLGLAFKLTALLVLGFFFTYHFISVSPTWLYWVMLFFALDFCFYWEHRAEHYVRILWAVHVTHHSSEDFNLTTGFRSSVFRPFISLWFFLPLTLLGFKPLDILVMDAFCQIYGIIVHTRFINKMPTWFDGLFVSPSHHRVHHASNILYLDKNMGMVLIIWDRLFGTFQREEDFEKVTYGLVKNVAKPFHPTHIIFHEWQQLLKDITTKGLNVGQRLKYLINPPGWSHDGSTKTAKELRKELYPNEI
jgi:sterol desaturase/sphingolipid hydroxylase (fatty acid hydroxylase superfamily)